MFLTTELNSDLVSCSPTDINNHPGHSACLVAYKLAMENLQNNITSKPWLSEKAQTVITDGMEFGKGSGDYFERQLRLYSANCRVYRRERILSNCGRLCTR